MDGQVNPTWDRLDDHALRAAVDGVPYEPWQLALLRQSLEARGVDLT